MSSWHSYPKVYAVGHRAVKELFEEEVIVEEKVDGSQFSFGIYDGELKCRSRGKEIDLDVPEKMFNKAIMTAKLLRPKLTDGCKYVCEYLSKPKHNTLAYDRVPEKNLILLDICPNQEAYVSYELKAKAAKELGLEVTPLLFKGKVETPEKVLELLDNVSILGGQKIEGVVCKNYLRFAVDGHAMFGKYVSEEFKERHTEDWKKRHPGSKDFIAMMGDEFHSYARWDKAIQHLKERGEYDGSPKDIGNLMKEVHVDLMEECGEEIKERLFKNAWKKIARDATRGLPEWYKEKLLASQFEGDK